MPSSDRCATHTFDFASGEVAALTAAAEVARVGVSGDEADALGEVYALLLTAEQTEAPVVVSSDQVDVLVAAVEAARAEVTGDADADLLPLYRKLLAAQMS